MPAIARMARSYKELCVNRQPVSDGDHHTTPSSNDRNNSTVGCCRCASR